MLKNFFSYVLVYAISIILTSLLFIGLFHTPLFNQIIVFFYKGLVFLVLCTLISGLITYYQRKIINWIDITIKDVFVVMSLFASITFVWFTLITVTVERSISVYMLSYMDQVNRPVAVSEFEHVFFENYIQKYGAFRKRFAEQLQSGNIKHVDGEGYEITLSGRAIVNIFRFSSKIFGTEEWLVYPVDYGFGGSKYDNSKIHNEFNDK